MYIFFIQNLLGYNVNLSILRSHDICADDTDCCRNWDGARTGKFAFFSFMSL